VSLTVAEGETLVLLGSSGCGKTTTLKMINRLIEPTEGAIEIDGADVLDRDPIELRRSVGYAFQGIGLFPHMTVRQNVEIIPKLLGWPSERRRSRAGELIEQVGLDAETYMDRYPDELSGGQQQRVGVARALAADPSHLLMDEPFGALDAVTRDALQQELLALRERLQKTIIFVTHDVFEALTLADRIAVLHEGRLEQVGEKQELLRRPGSDFVRELFAKPRRQMDEFRGLLA
jgi:osmoprotectant transport system ATP-binding protein